ncbi:MAG: MFS transporter [Candidatus Peregrinibacteria bacterium]|nr:MFS transporter [Candidatus Peregrinibacteria bacterium]
MKDRRQFIVIATILTDMVGLGIILPVLPIYVQQFGISTFTIGLLTSIFALFSFVAGPILGSLSDKYGRRPILIISILGTAIGWYMFAMAHHLWIIFLARAIDGATAGNVSVAQSYLTDLATDQKDRIMKLSLISTCIGIGFIAGPAIGGLLSEFSPTLPFWVTAGIATVNGVLAIFFLPESIREKKKDLHIGWNPFTSIWYAISNIKYRTYILLIFFTTLAFESYHSSFFLYVSNVFGMTKASSGLLFSGIGILIALNQVVFMKHFWLKFFKPHKVQVITASALIIIFLGLSQFSMVPFLLTVCLLGITEGTLISMNGGELSGVAQEHERGKIIGISHSLIALSQMIGPAISGYAMDYHVRWPWMIASFWMVIVLGIIIIKNKQLKKSEVNLETGITY